MHLTPTELDRLLIFSAAELARRRRARRWRLTHPEALAIICDEMHEAARGGASYDEVVRAGQRALTEDDVLEGVPAMIGSVKVECLFEDGMRVLHVERPIGPGRARPAASARPGSRRAGATARRTGGRPAAARRRR
jgi:urease subunit gamma/beta